MQCETNLLKNLRRGGVWDLMYILKRVPWIGLEAIYAIVANAGRKCELGDAVKACMRGVATPRGRINLPYRLPCAFIPAKKKRKQNARDAIVITLGVHRNIRLLLSRRRRHRHHRNDSLSHSTPEKRALARPRHVHLART